MRKCGTILNKDFIIVMDSPIKCVVMCRGRCQVCPNFSVIDKKYFETKLYSVRCVLQYEDEKEYFAHETINNLLMR